MSGENDKDKDSPTVTAYKVSFKEKSILGWILKLSGILSESSIDKQCDLYTNALFGILLISTSFENNLLNGQN